MNDFTGSRYLETRDLDIADIAKLVRKDLRDAQKGGLFPAEMTFTVRIDRYSGGQSLNVTLAGMPDTWTYVSPGLEPNYAEYVPANGGYTDEARAALELAEKIRNMYNFDRSDVQTDYFNVRFYGSTKIQDEREKSWADRWAAERKARKTERRAARTR